MRNLVSVRVCVCVCVCVCMRSYILDPTIDERDFKIFVFLN